MKFFSDPIHAQVVEEMTVITWFFLLPTVSFAFVWTVGKVFSFFD